MSERLLAEMGAGWLLERPERIFTPEECDKTTERIREAVRSFVDRDVMPVLDRLEGGELDLSIGLMRTAGELGFLGAEIPEDHGGLDLPKVVSTVICEELGRTAGFAVTFGAHATIGTLPLVYFGTEEQKARYLPRLASGDWLAAYALTESGSGSDALGARTQATLSPDGTEYRLNGDKMWISNSGFAGLFTVFAKVDGLHFSAFLVERSFPGLSFGEEERKMGIRSSSTRAVYLDNVPVPVDNLLGEVGKGDRIALNVLNVGRYKLGAACVGAAKHVLELSCAYSHERRQFGRPIGSFGLIQQKLAEIAIRTFVAESAVYRTVGLIDDADAGPGRAALTSLREYAIEASLVKVLASEALDFSVDEALQIHGGYGFSAENPIERAYRDSRINRIFEGTNEINRLLIPGMLLRRALKGELPLAEAAQRVRDELLEPGGEEEPDPDLAALDRMKKLVLILAGSAVERHGPAIEEEQEILGAVADIMIGIYGVESAVIRASRLRDDYWRMMAKVALVEAAHCAQISAYQALPRIAEGDELRLMLSAARRLTKVESYDVISARRTISEAVLKTAGYPKRRLARAASP